MCHVLANWAFTGTWTFNLFRIQDFSITLICFGAESGPD